MADRFATHFSVKGARGYSPATLMVGMTWYRLYSVSYSTLFWSYPYCHPFPLPPKSLHSDIFNVFFGYLSLVQFLDNLLKNNVFLPLPNSW